jgi:methyl-accepting chemotaxis protein
VHLDFNISLCVNNIDPIERVEEAAEEAIEAVERVAETAEKIAEDVAEAFPENKSLKKAASRIKAITYEVEEDANKAEAILHKVRSIAY